LKSLMLPLLLSRASLSRRTVPVKEGTVQRRKPTRSQASGPEETADWIAPDKPLFHHF
jgi:hypothetical protein